MTRLQLLQVLLLAVAGLSAVFPSSALAQQTQDWLRTPVQAAATVVQPDATTIVLGNSLLTRTFTTTPAFGTVNLEVNATLAHGGRRSLLRAFKPEGYVTLDNTTYALGWNLPLRCREREREGGGWCVRVAKHLIFHQHTQAASPKIPPSWPT